MIFKKKKQCRRGNTSSELEIPVDFGGKRGQPSASELKGFYRRPVVERLQIGNEFSPHFGIPKHSNRSHRDLSQEVRERPYREEEEDDEAEMRRATSSRKSKSRERMMKGACKSVESLKSLSELRRMRPESKESRKKPKMFFTAEKKHEKTGRAYSLIPIRRKTTPNSKADCMSIDGSATTFTILPVGFDSQSLNLAASAKSSEKSNKIEKSTKSCLSVTEEFPAMEKSTQTYPGGVLVEVKKKVSVGTQGSSPMRHYGVQVAAKRRHEEVQCSPNGESGTLETGETDSKSVVVCTVQTQKSITTMNVAVQANTSKRKKQTTSNVGLQINLPTEESLKYLNDLQVQKKVNMAIAELCFHLSQEKEQEGA